LSRLRPDLPALGVGLPVVVLLIVWAGRDGGFNADTWYWGALLVLALLTAALVGLGSRRPRIPRAGSIALGLFALYVAWSYLSMSWASSAGDALEGSNRALLFFLVFALMLVVPWRPSTAHGALVIFAGGIGLIAVVLLVRFASADQVSDLIAGSRLAAPTGYFNSTAALFTIGTFLSISLAVRRGLPGPMRGLLLAFACGELQLALIVQSRGWLFTLPLMAAVAVLLATDRLRLTLFAIIPLAGAAAPLHRLLAVFSSSGSDLSTAAGRAGQAGLVACGTVFVVGTLLSWGDWLARDRVLTARRRRALGLVLVALTLAAVGTTATVATHGHPVAFAVRQWNGFTSRKSTFSTRSHFGDIGSGRFDFWRVSLQAALAHPIGGLGQDNFADYYVLHRHGPDEPRWTHSLEMRLLAHTGLVGLILFAGFIIAALTLALRGRRHAEARVRHVCAAALVPLVVWLIYGSIDWFWEMPALSGAALGFLGLACSLGGAAQGHATQQVSGAAREHARPVRVLIVLSGAAAVLAATFALSLPYLSVRMVSIASAQAATDPARALVTLADAARLNPYSAVPGRLAGAIALQAGEDAAALGRFRQAIAREPGGWFSWLGAGLAASGVGDRRAARRYFTRAYAINPLQPADKAAIRRVDSAHPLTWAQAQELFIVVH